MMGYHPATMVCGFPPYPRTGRRQDGSTPRTFGWLLYSLEPWIGFDIWHIDPEKRSEGQRTDDSCGWFDRRPGPYADAVAYVLKDDSTMREIVRSLATRIEFETEYGPYKRIPAGECLAITFMVARELELRRWWNGVNGNGGAWASTWHRLFTRKRDVTSLAADLALNPIDNLSSVEDPEALVRMIAGAMHRRFRPWWRHPRWHVHHWQVNFHIVRNVRRMFQPCGTCGHALGFGCCPTRSAGALHHGECLGHGGPWKTVLKTEKL